MPAKKRNSAAATRQSVTSPAAIQQERAEILAVLLDDAGKDWKPRKKGTTQHRATTAPAKQSQASKPSPVTLTPAQQREQQQILSILLDDAGKDWKPRVKGTRPASQGRPGGKAPAATKTPPVKTARPVSAKPKQAPTPVSSVKSKSPAQLTAAQKLEQQQILSILLDDAGKDWKPRNKSKTQHKPQQAKQSPKQAPVAHKQAPVAHKQAPVAHKAAPAKPLTPAQQREQLEILSILIDFKEPPAKVAPKQAAKPAPAAHNKPTPAKTPTKSQPVQQKPQPAQNKSQPTQNKQNVQPTKHIVKNQPRGVKMTT